MFSRYFLHLLLVNLLLLASLEERYTHSELGYFLGVRNEDGLEERFLVSEATGDRFALFWKTVAGLEVEAFPCFWE